IKMGNDLIKHGCVPNKSLILKYPDNLDEEYFGSFLCGYFDGDGCLTYTHINHKPKSNEICLMGTYEFLEVVEEKLNKHGIRTTGIQKTASKIFSLDICK